MPRITPPTELDPLVALIAAQPDGLGIEAIQSQSNSLPRRTLQRRLALLVAQGRIQMLGEARAVRPPVGYKLAFLEQYRPNHTAYLPQGLRDQLHTMGTARAAQTTAGTFARDILNRLLIDLSWASSRLEGNTYSRLDTARLIEFGQAHAQVTPDCSVALHASR